MYDKIDAYIDRLIRDSSPDAPIWNIESIRQGKKPHWNYIDGCMITALMEISAIKNDKRYLDFAERFIDYYVRDDGSILGYDIAKYNLDDINDWIDEVCEVLHSISNLLHWIIVFFVTFEC